MQGQTPGNFDRNWQLVWSDPFNYGNNDVTGFNNMENSQKWVYIESFGNHQYKATNTCNNYYAEKAVNKHFPSNGICRLEANKNAGNYVYPCQYCWATNGGGINPQSYYFNTTGAQLITRDTFKYGAFELKFRWPDIDLYANDPNTGIPNIEKVRGMFPAFWMFPHSPPGPGSQYHEIDFFEMTPHRYNLCGVSILHDINSNKNARNINKTYKGISEASAFKITDFTNGKYHVVTGEWNPDYVNIYVDGKLYVSYNWEQDQLVPMNVYISLGGSTQDATYQDYCSTSNTLSPYNMDIDYLKVYKLNASSLTDVNVLSNYNWASYGITVKKSITLGGTGGTNNIVPVNTKYSLRATNFILLGDGFECGASTDFFAMVQKIN